MAPRRLRADDEGARRRRINGVSQSRRPAALGLDGADREMLARAPARALQHFAAGHGPLRWGVPLPARLTAIVDGAGVVTASAQRVYREHRHAGAAHAAALAAAVDASAEGAALGDED